jgi:hypothetical protein
MASLTVSGFVIVVVFVTLFVAVPMVMSRMAVPAVRFVTAGVLRFWQAR